VRYCDKKNLYHVVECDSNAHHSVWGKRRGRPWWNF
jgi:hypothetical protein